MAFNMIIIIFSRFLAALLFIGQYLNFWVGLLVAIVMFLIAIAALAWRAKNCKSAEKGVSKTK
jgi:putative solute:sodium symporter small subunit